MEVDTTTGGRAELSDAASEDGPYTIHGVALKGGDETRGSSKQWKRWTKEALSEAAHTLKNKNLVRDHVNDKISAVIGEVTDAKYREGEGVLFQAEVDDEEIADQISRGRLDVSARVSHPDSEELEETDDGMKIVDEVKQFLNLSLVPDGASPSNWVRSGSPENLSATELAAAFDYDSESGSEDAQSASEGEDDATPSEESESTENESDELEEVVELMSVHSVSYSDTSSSSEWSSLAMEDFETDDLSEIGGHFFASSSGFPPENFGDLSLEIVDEDGNLTLGGLDSAWKTVEQTDGLSEDQVSTVKTKIENLVQDEFSESDLAERVSGSDEEENSQEAEGEELEQEEESPSCDLDGLTVMSDDEFDSMMEGEASADTEENQKTAEITVCI